MKGMARVEIVKRINDLEDRHCETCDRPKRKLSNYCATQCEVGKKIKVLGDHLLEKTNSERKKKAERVKKVSQAAVNVEVSKEKYLSLKELELSDYKIASKFGITPAKLSSYKKGWGLEGFSLKKGKKQEALPKNQEPDSSFQELKSKLSQIMDENESLKQEVETLRSKKVELLDQISSLRSDKESNTQKVANVKQQLAEEYEEEMAKVEGELQKYKELYKTLAAAFATHLVHEPQ